MVRQIRRLREETLAGEAGVVRKDWGGKLRVALVYPNRYRVAMSNLGFLSVHARINARPDALCERAFLPGPEEEAVLSRRRLPLGTLESGRPLSDFDVVAFSLSYENDLANLPRILSAGRVPPFRTDREGGGGRAPLVLAGGFAASLSPEPSGTIADAVVVGDGERAVEAFLTLGAPRPGDPGYLREIARIPGVYVPAGYRPAYREAPSGARRLAALDPLPGFPARVRREEVPLDRYPPPAVVLAGEAELGRMALVETSRGCPKRCAFCAASHACEAFREAPLEQVLRAAERAWPHRKTVGLVGAAVLDWGPFREFSREILARGGAVSPASVRADLVDGEVARILARSRLRTVAMAPECGDPGHRARLGKRVEDGIFLEAARILAREGISSFKLYFLTGVPGIPGEEEAGAIRSFLRRFRDLLREEGRATGRLGTVTAVLSPFVPKPFTPLQWAGMARREEIEARHAAVRAMVRREANLRLAADSADTAIREGYLGLSDRRVEGALRDAAPGRLRIRGRPLPVPLDEVLHRERGADEFLPWDVVEAGLPKRVLRARYEAISRG